MLVVDDEPIVRDVVVRYLQSAGYRTLEAGDGDAGRQRRRDQRPGLEALMSTAPPVESDTGSGAAPSFGPTVLLVEDERSIGTLVRGYLERAGYRVIWVRSGEEALIELARHPVRMVVVDIGLPGMDGLDV